MEISNFEDVKVKIEQKSKTSRRLSILRLVFFVLGITTSILSFNLKQSLPFTVASVLLFIVFFALCIIHGKVKKDIVFFEEYLKTGMLYHSRQKGDFDPLEDKGNEFLDTNDDYSLDLDVFGGRSLFALYNISETFGGRERFADSLLGRNIRFDVKERQEAVKELTDDIDFLISYQTTARLGRLRKPLKAIERLSTSKRKMSRDTRAFYKFSPFFWVLPIVFAFIMPRFVSAAVLGVVAINIIIWFLISMRYAEVFNGIDTLSRQCDAVSSLILLLEKKNFTSSALAVLVKGGAKGDRKASQAFASLSHVLYWCQFRSQPIFALLTNAVLPFDLVLADQLLRWKDKFGEEIITTLDCLYEAESLMCAAVPGIVSREASFPVFVEDGGDCGKNAFFDGTDIVHPLLDPSAAVSNSIRLENNIALITGSNMSGKTTLIRTVGVLSLLSYTGAKVPCKSLTLGRMRIISSMRIVDDLGEEMSTFKAELVRISRIVDASKEERPILFLIDEIFRGTNSTDRTEGALAVLKRLSKPYITGLMTTHDYALCDKVTGSISNIVYYHFSEKYDDAGISFDYKLHDGVSHESNAAFLMKLVGIM